MNFTRRDWVAGFVTALPFSLLGRMPALQDGARCSGEIRGPGGARHAGWTVELIQPNGKILKVKSDENGRYAFQERADSGPYVLVFRNPASAVMHEVRRLTEGIQQTVAVTIDPNSKTFESVYSRIQALESIAAFAQAAPDARNAVRGDVQRIPELVAALRDSINALPPAQNRFLSGKASNVEQFARGAVV